MDKAMSNDSPLDLSLAVDEGDRELRRDKAVRMVVATVVVTLVLGLFAWLGTEPEVPPLSKYAEETYGEAFRKHGLLEISFARADRFFPASISIKDREGVKKSCNGRCGPEVEVGDDFEALPVVEVVSDEAGRLLVKASVDTDEYTFDEVRKKFDRVMTAAIQHYAEYDGRRRMIRQSWNTHAASSAASAATGP